MVAVGFFPAKEALMRILPQQAASAAYCWASRLGEKRGFAANRNSTHGVNSGVL